MIKKSNPARNWDVSICEDCGFDTKEGLEYYMVHDHLWPSDTRILCLGCLEKRIGRPLTKADFTDDVINDPICWPMSDRFLKILEYHGRQADDPLSEVSTTLRIIAVRVQ